MLKSADKRTGRRGATWYVVRWDGEPEVKGSGVVMTCECGREAEVPCGILEGGVVMAVIGRSVIFDPADFKAPSNWLPNSIRCRRCGRLFTTT